eukprot:8907785-Lingulodinium_polyedra.AAC.1
MGGCPLWRRAADSFPSQGPGARYLGFECACRLELPSQRPGGRLRYFDCVWPRKLLRPRAKGALF